MAVSARTQEHDPGQSHVNEVRLRGRLAAIALERTLPSGDVVATFRIVVDRPPVRPGSPSTAKVDTLDCAAFRADARRRLARIAPGEVIEVEGSLRRRFYRAGAAAASRYEVEVRTLVRASRSSTVGRGTMTG